MPPVYYVLATPRAHYDNAHIRSGPYDALEKVAKFVAPQGPPLPIIIKCDKKGEDDLVPIVAAINKVGGGNSVANAEHFVKAIIDEIRDMSIWPHKEFYGLLRSPKVRKFVAPEYASVVDYINGTNEFVLYTFPTLVHAIIWTLAGGNNKLRQWHLVEWLAKPRSKNTPTPSTPRRATGPSFSASPIPFTLTQSTSENQARTPEKHGQQKDDTADDDDSRTSGSITRMSSPLGNKTRQKGKQRAASTESRELRPYTLPSHLVPVEYLRSPAITSSPAPFIARRSAQQSSRTLFTGSTDASIISQVNGPLKGDSRLPPLALFYLIAHGWQDSVIDIVASTRDMPFDHFLTMMSRAMSMNLAEASFLWHLLQSPV